MFLVSGAVLIALSSFGQSPSEKGKIIGAIKDEVKKPSSLPPFHY